MPKPHAHVPAGHPSLPRSPVSRVPRPSTPPSPACRPFECEAGTTPSDSTPHSPSPRARAAFSARTQSRRRRGAGARPRPVGCGCHCRAISVLSCRLGTPSRTLQHTARQTDRLAKTADHPPTPRELSERYSLAATLFFIQPPVSLSSPPWTRPQRTCSRHHKPEKRRRRERAKKGPTPVSSGGRGGWGKVPAAPEHMRARSPSSVGFARGAAHPCPGRKRLVSLEARTKRGARWGARRVGRS